MKVNRMELRNALEMVKPALASKEIIEQSTSFAFMGDRIVTYNDEISISHPVSGLDVVGAIQAHELYQFINKVKREEIEIEWMENQVTITAGKSKAGFILQSEITLPTEEIGDIGKWSSLPDNFVAGLRFCNPACSKDMSRPIITCVHVNSNGYIEASDGFRLSRFVLDDAGSLTDVLIPSSSITELVKFDIKKIAKGNGWAHFKTDDDTVFSCRIFEDEYPKIESILDFDGTILDLPKKMDEVLERASIFARTEFETDATVSVGIAGGVMTISSKAEAGWFKETLRTKYDGESLNFRANPVFLSEMLGKVESCIFGDEKIRFESTNWQHVICLTIGD